MNAMKIMEILNRFESQAISEIKQDREIDADPYESVGKYKLIRKIRKRIVSEIGTHDKEAA